MFSATAISLITDFFGDEDDDSDKNEHILRWEIKPHLQGKQYRKLGRRNVII